MTKRAVAALTLALLLCRPGPAGAIVNGKEVTESDWYAHAVVGISMIDDKGREGACTGTLLTPRIVLTAAHCIAHMKTVSVVFDFKIGNAHKVVATKTVINPDFIDKENQINPGDLAIVFLPSHNYPTAVVPLDGDLTFTEGQQFVILGYGRSKATRFRSSGVLRKAAIGATGEDTPREVALRPLTDAWPCDGDSGGPVLRKDMSGHYAVSGVMSTVYAGPTGECLFDGSFMTPVHTYADWIKTTMAEGQ